MTSSLPLGDEALEGLIAGELDRIEARLAHEARSTHPIIADASGHLMSAGGKRLRPVLVMLTSQLGSGIDEAVRQAAVATELTHLATLYHDDVMDSAPLRRGAPSAHEVWGNSVAILVGDLLFARASQLVSELGPVAVRIQADAFERLVLGQLHETLGPGADDDPIAHYLRVLADKTGSLISASAHYGALFAGADAEIIAAVVAYGEKVGVAFQLADDVIDLISDAEVTGKTPGTDLREGVATMPVLLLRAQAARGEIDAAGTDILTALEGDLSDDASLAAALDALRAHPILDESRELARQWAADAVAELAPLPEGPAKDALTSFAGLLVDRLA
ncbi:polyprenyl synthetase family protein [Pseudactinotalea sp. HY158]|uniref:polyprenyl synthetase family protein n=1 Tax=Pseudactinotalea sp. HY158 TaxID=2654547 RepID=UPI00129C89FF|nr:polyprenyl synthetase family protein [Pseudactinotalea sp. HY158]QGH70468.1 polyprenyl synthetase family protein [Pseudactinotalea sp. HY158]